MSLARQEQQARVAARRERVLKLTNEGRSAAEIAKREGVAVTTIHVDCRVLRSEGRGPHRREANSDADNHLPQEPKCDGPTAVDRAIQAERCEKLWRAAVAQCAATAISSPNGRRRNDFMHWVGTENFRECCTLANLSAEWVARLVNLCTDLAKRAPPARRGIELTLIAWIRGGRRGVGGESRRSARQMLQLMRDNGVIDDSAWLAYKKAAKVRVEWNDEP